MGAGSILIQQVTLILDLCTLSAAPGLMEKPFGTRMLGESSPQRLLLCLMELGPGATAHYPKLCPSVIGTLECLLTAWGINERTIGEIRLECPTAPSRHTLMSSHSQWYHPHHPAPYRVPAR